MIRRLSSRSMLGILVASFGGLVALAASSCTVGELELTGHPCPCAAAGFVCDTNRNLCVPSAELLAATPCLGESCTCATSADCKDPAFTRCLDQKCVECEGAPDTCTAGRYCLPSHFCAPGCKSDGECLALSPTAPYCNLARHQCVNCRSDGDCTNGDKCSPAGACVEACTAGACGSGKACCNGLCLDTLSDPLNCNACGKVCDGAQTACCGGTCTDPLTTATDCGRCGAACSNANGSPTCFAGSCRWNCRPGFSHCANGNTGCETSTGSNVKQCGGCGTDCTVRTANANGVTCVASACSYTTCTAGHYDCDGVAGNGCECTSPTECGLRGQFCCPGNVCTTGTCEPKPNDDGRCH